MKTDAPARSLPGVCVLCGQRFEADEVDLLAVLARSGYPHQYVCHPECLKAVAVPNFAGISDLELSREEFDARRRSVVQRFTPRARRALASTSQLAHGYVLGVRADVVERLDALLRSAAYNEPLQSAAEDGGDEHGASQ